MSRPNSKTRCGRILQRLEDARGGEVPAPEIARVGGLQWQTRISELRHKFGFRIPPPRSEMVNGEEHTWYRLVFDAEFDTTTVKASSQPSSEESDRLFP